MTQHMTGSKAAHNMLKPVPYILYNFGLQDINQHAAVGQTCLIPSAHLCACCMQAERHDEGEVVPHQRDLQAVPWLKWNPEQPALLPAPAEPVCCAASEF